MSRLPAGVLLAAPALGLLLAFLAVPYVDMVVMSLRNPGHGQAYGAGFTLANYARALTGPVYLAALGRTMLLGTVVTAGCLVLSYPVAMHLAGAGDGGPTSCSTRSSSRRCFSACWCAISAG